MDRGAAGAAGRGASGRPGAAGIEGRLAHRRRSSPREGGVGRGEALGLGEDHVQVGGQPLLVPVGLHLAALGDVDLSALLGHHDTVASDCSESPMAARWRVP